MQKGLGEGTMQGNRIKRKERMSEIKMEGEKGTSGGRSSDGDGGAAVSLLVTKGEGSI